MNYSVQFEPKFSRITNKKKLELIHLSKLNLEKSLIPRFRGNLSEIENQTIEFISLNWKNEESEPAYRFNFQIKSNLLKINAKPNWTYEGDYGYLVMSKGQKKYLVGFYHSKNDGIEIDLLSDKINHLIDSKLASSLLETQTQKKIPAQKPKIQNTQNIGPSSKPIKKAKWGVYYYSNIFYQDKTVKNRRFVELLNWWDKIHRILNYSDKKSQKHQDINYPAPPQGGYKPNLAVAFHINTYAKDTSRDQRQMGTMKIMPGIDEMHLENAEARDGSTARTFKGFIDYAYKNAPAENVIIIINGHAASWSFFAPTKYDINSNMNIIEVTKAMNKRKAKLIYIYGCNMADIETFAELSQVSDYILASQGGQQYQRFFTDKNAGGKVRNYHVPNPFVVLTELSLNPKMSKIKEIARYTSFFIDENKWYLSYTDKVFIEYWKKINNLILIDSQQVNSLLESMNNFAGKIVNSKSSDRHITIIKNKVLKNIEPIIKYFNVVDLVHFSSQVINESIAMDIKFASVDMLNKVKAAMVTYFGTSVKESHYGISTQFPLDTKLYRYDLRKSLYLSKRAPHWSKLCELLANKK